MTTPDARHRAPPAPPRIAGWLVVTVVGVAIVAATVAVAAWLGPDPAPPRAAAAPTVARALWTPTPLPTLRPLNVPTPQAAAPTVIATDRPLSRLRPRRVTATPRRTIAAAETTTADAPVPTPEPAATPEPEPPAVTEEMPVPEEPSPTVTETPEPTPTDVVPLPVEIVTEPEVAP